MLGIQYKGWVNEVFNVGSGANRRKCDRSHVAGGVWEKVQPLYPKFRLGDIRLIC